MTSFHTIYTIQLIVSEDELFVNIDNNIDFITIELH